MINANDLEQFADELEDQGSSEAATVADQLRLVAGIDEGSGLIEPDTWQSLALASLAELIQWATLARTQIAQGKTTLQS